MPHSRTKIDIPCHVPLVIVGAGVVGLWCAVKAVRLGLAPLVLDAGAAGGGASNGHLGALMPHQPVNWSVKKQAQLEGLLALETEVTDLESRTGLSCGYRRCGRIVPLTTAAQRERHVQWAQAARLHWPGVSPGGQALAWRLCETNPAPGWIAEEASPFGFAMETLSARLAPRRLIAALKAALAGRALLAGNLGAKSIEPDGTVHLDDGRVMRGERVILSAGWRSSALLAGGTSMPPVTGVKGQSALLQPEQPLDPALPLLFDDGVYAIVHEDGLVAVGSTSEKQWSDPESTDDRLDAVIARARALSPALRTARVVDRWAGIRPRGPSAAPVTGRLGESRIVAATAGFKITFAIAHDMADAALAEALAMP
ncbi:NAD(P)/FAD-dependent oxidoreductase [Zhengella sp. ZM62]|uniref:NAD(P)/FAD-dependent oxidoreductase n=1 Tax=Zhengella sedimenti TaxID=3390035 RepID=UPI003975D239